jgi:hypothetical protein
MGEAADDSEIMGLLVCTVVDGRLTWAFEKTAGRGALIGGGARLGKATLLS